MANQRLSLEGDNARPKRWNGRTAVPILLATAIVAGCGSAPPAIDAPTPPRPAPPAPERTAVRPEAQDAAQAAANCSVVLYGDSILHGGYGGTKRLAEPPSATLKRWRPKYTISDRTGNGETATARAASFLTEPRTSRFVVIAHGINDAAQALPLEPALRQMVSKAQTEGRIVILTGLSRQTISVPRRLEHEAVIRMLATRTGAAFADWGSVPFRREDMADVIHPAKPYSDRLVEAIVAVLDEYAPECRS